MSKICKQLQGEKKYDMVVSLRFILNQKSWETLMWPVHVVPTNILDVKNQQSDLILCTIELLHGQWDIYVESTFKTS